MLTTRKSFFSMLVGLLIATTFLVGLSEKSAAGEPAKFNSYKELVEFIEKNTERDIKTIRLEDQVFGGGSGGAAEIPAGRISKSKATVEHRESADSFTLRAGGGGAPDYSETNNQVQGVDEADLVKTDGKYLYIIDNEKLSIIQAYPVGEATKLSEIEFSGRPVEAFINNDSLMVFGKGSAHNQMFIQKYDVTNREKPILEQDVYCDGRYVTSRMIDNHVYTVINIPVILHRTSNNDKENNAEVNLPKIITNGKEHTIAASDIYHFNCPDYSYRYTLILSTNIQQKSAQWHTKTFLTGASQNIFASTNNIYLTGSKTPDFDLYTKKLLDSLATMVPDNIGAKIKATQDSSKSYREIINQVEIIMEEYVNTLDYEKASILEEKIEEHLDKWDRDIKKDKNKTVIYKMATAKGSVEYQCKGEVNGHVLNQFSMDEYNGYFRIATTSKGSLFNDSTTRNNIYVLDKNLQVSGSVLGLAPTERIYSARFMGNRAYLVTFRRTDPLFVIDLHDPNNPAVLGELKIPGYSDYLHPYNENYLIGIGKEVSETPAIQIEMGDVTITPGPVQEITVELDGVVKGPFKITALDIEKDKATTSPPPPKAPAIKKQVDDIRILPPPTREQGVKIALFDVSNPTAPKEVAKYVVEQDNSSSLALRDHRAVLFDRNKNLLAIPINYRTPFRTMENSSTMPRNQHWEGLFVFDISPQQGIKLKGKVEHLGEQVKGQKYYNTIERSLYIENVLYTISQQMVGMHDLDDLRELNKIYLQ